MYGYYCLKLSKVELAKIYGKHPTTILNWIQRYDENQIHTRKERERTSLKFTAEERAWIVQLYQSYPVLLLDDTWPDSRRRLLLLDARRDFDNFFRLHANLSTAVGNLLPFDKFSPKCHPCSHRVFSFR
uniref:(northern house mosquito) hypothetical protein n=1 Tax=Culex pipiens TaxID=7175 RepID=A0A8D8A3Z4_CULPI